MVEPSSDRCGEWGWNRGNRLAIACLLLLLAGLAGWRLWRHPARLTEPLVVEYAALAPAQEQIDPNSAGWASLARLTGIGPTLARAIVTYRENFTAAHPGEVPFRTIADLQRVPGIGPGIAAAVAPSLCFPAADDQP